MRGIKVESKKQRPLSHTHVLSLLASAVAKYNKQPLELGGLLWYIISPALPLTTTTHLRVCCSRYYYYAGAHKRRGHRCID
jgi:hypothetical protein